MRRDLARERLQEIRKLIGWREAEKVAGLSPGRVEDYKSKAAWEGSRRRRLSRLINRQTTGAKRLDTKQRAKINRAYKTKGRTEKIAEGRADLEIKAVNKDRLEARRKANQMYGPGGTFPDAQKLRSRLRQNANLTAEDKKRIRDSFKNADKDGGRAIRAEYAQLLSSFKITNLPPRQRDSFRRRKTKAVKAVERDEAQQRLEV